jgi:abequosyltransferase
MKPYLLTICIATYNRADCLAVTLDNIVSHVGAFDDVEVLVVDGNSTDHTEAVVSKIQSAHRNFNYIKLREKGGVDKDFDIAVQYSSGRYCWLFTDDDLLKDSSISKVRRAILKGNDLIVVNSEICDYNYHKVLKKSALPIDTNLEVDLSPLGREKFFKSCATYISFIGAIVIKKTLWIELPRNVFYGTRFIHVGVISTLSNATKVLVLTEPMIKIRLGNAEWSNITFKVWAELWPALIWSFSNLSEDCKRSICLLEPWKSAPFLLWARAIGTYTKLEYLEYISHKPNSLYKFMAKGIATLPQLIPHYIFYCYATIKRDELMLYYLGEGSESKNSWLSTD